MAHKEKVAIIKFGGSQATDADGANQEYLTYFLQNLTPTLRHNFQKAVFVIGGGPRVREQQKLVSTDREKDEIAMEILTDHASGLSRAANLAGIKTDKRIARNEKELRFLLDDTRAFAIALGGLKAGQSTDTVAVRAAELYAEQGCGPMIVILSNIWAIFTSDPKTNPEAIAIKEAHILNLITEGILASNPQDFRPGMSVTIDPVATNALSQPHNRKALLPLYFAHGENMEGTIDFLNGRKPTRGTLVTGQEIPTQYYLNR